MPSLIELLAGLKNKNTVDIFINLNCNYNEDYIDIHLVMINFQVFLYKVTEKIYYPANSNESLIKSLSLIQWTKPVIYSVWMQKNLARKLLEV